MEIIETKLAGALILYPKVWRDERGYFLESYRAEQLSEYGIQQFVQDNESFSTYGVIRGLHYQIGEHAQGKLVRVITGEILDVIVDIRPGSPTYGQHISVILNDIAKKQLYIPPGFAHGFAVLSEEVIFSYKCTAYYHPESEHGIKYDDPQLDIDWAIPMEDRIISAKDNSLPYFGEHR